MEHFAFEKTTKVSFTATNMSAFTEAVERGLKGLEHVSTGACPGCHECGLETERCPKCKGFGEVDYAPCDYCRGDGDVDVSPDNQKKIDHAEEPHFSWHACDCCGSDLGGDRHPAHGIAKINDRETLVHLDVCTDCLCYLANGDEPEEWRP